jgi:hypothetical protein
VIKRKTTATIAASLSERPIINNRVDIVPSKPPRPPGKMGNMAGVHRVEDITEALWGTRVSAIAVDRFIKNSIDKQLLLLWLAQVGSDMHYPLHDILTVNQLLYFHAHFPGLL